MFVFYMAISYSSQPHSIIPAVGENLQDHLVCLQPFETHEKLGLSESDDRVSD